MVNILAESREKSCFESTGEITLKGQRIPYRTVCEDTFFHDKNGNPSATVFSYAYLRSDVEDPSTRPVMFSYNGGPGCASLWLHLGIMGPRRLKLDDELHLPTVPPFELEDNPHCLLDICDIVMVDPAGTGLGRVWNEEEKENFYGSDNDIYTLSLFIENWLCRHKRRNSPVILAGESYGTGRSALLAGELLGAGPKYSEMMGVAVSGIILLGSYFFDRKPPIEKAVTDLYSMAATNHFHHPEGKPERDEFLRQAENFAADEYLPALYRGDALCEEKQAEIAKKLSHFTGVQETYIRDHRLRIDMRDFLHLVLEDEKLMVGFYDSRYTWPELKTVQIFNTIADDAAMGQYTPAFQTAFALLREELNITFDRGSKGLSLPINMDWDRTFKRSPADSLAGAMRRNPRLKVLFASGMYDMCTTAGNAHWLAYHSNLDPDRVLCREYPSGHMAYLGEESATMFGQDMREFVLDVTGKK